MLKWILRIGYIFLVILGLAFVNREADSEKRLKYLNEQGMPYYYEDRVDEYFEHFMIATSRTKYLKVPVYQAVSNEEGAKFKISFYHTRAETKQGKADILTIVLSDINIKVNPNDNDNYLKNSNNIRLRLNLNFNQGHIYQDYNLKGESLALTSTSTLGAAIPIEISIGEKDNEKLFGISEGTASILESVTLELIDNTSDSSLNKTTPIAKLINDNSDTEMFGVIDYLVKSEISFPVYSDGDVKEELIVESLISTKFNGLPDKYDIGKIYDDVNQADVIVITNQDKLKTYNKVVNKYYVFYALIVIVVTYLLFFLKPTISYFKRKKSLSNTEEDTNKEEAIFKDK